MTLSTKSEINTNTKVNRLNRNNLSYSYENQGRYFRVDALSSELIVTEEDELGKQEFMITNVSTKKEFVDAVYNYIH